MMNLPVMPREYIQSWQLRVFVVLCMVIAVIAIVCRRQQTQVAPPALTRKRPDALDGRLCHDDKVDALSRVQGGPVEPVKDGRAGRTRFGHIRSEHETVDDEAIVRARKKLRELYSSNGIVVIEILAALLKDVILRYRTTRRQLPPHPCYILESPPQLNLGLEEAVASATVLRTFSRKALGMQSNLLFFYGHVQRSCSVGNIRDFRGYIGSDTLGGKPRVRHKW
jgi:hypothetical protein